jgi:hypothetical protein
MRVDNVVSDEKVVVCINSLRASNHLISVGEQGGSSDTT